MHDTRTGTGAFSVVPAFNVAVPGTAYAVTYTSTVTLTIISGP